MKLSLRTMLVGAFLTLSVIYGFSEAQNQGNPAGSLGTRVAVIDIAKVFDGHPGFKQQMELMKSDVEKVEAEFQQRRKQLESMRERQKQFQPGSPEYKDLDSQIMESQAQGQVQVNQKGKEFMEREANIHLQIYTEILTEVAAFARQNNIGLVLRFNSKPIEPERQSILEGINRNVVFQDRLNITTQIIDQIQRRYATQANKNVPPATNSAIQR